jgi:hypothetical protein
VKRGVKCFTLVKYRAPGEPRLKAFEHEVLKHSVVGGHRDAPLAVVVGFHEGVDEAPGAFIVGI